MRRFGALLVTLTLISLALAAQGWTLEDCVEVNYDHPDCEQYWTTTTAPATTTTAEVTTTTGQTTTTQPEVTTTQPEVTTTTPNVTTTQPTTTETQPPPTTTTIQECPPGTEHNPPFCTPVLVPAEPQTPTTTAPVTTDTLPFTGPSVDPAMLGAFASLSLGLGLIALGRSGRKREDV